MRSPAVIEILHRRIMKEHLVVCLFLLLAQAASASIVFMDVEYDLAFPKDIRRQFTFCEETTALGKVLNESSVYFKGVYQPVGSDTGTYQVVLQDKDGNEVGPLRSNSGELVFISQSGKSLFEVNGFTFKFPIKDLCKYFGNKPLASDDFEKLISSLKISAKVHQ